MGEKKLNVAFMAICFTDSDDINKVINITIVFVLIVFINTELGLKCHCYSTLSHIKPFRMSQNQALNYKQSLLYLNVSPSLK